MLRKTLFVVLGLALVGVGLAIVDYRAWVAESSARLEAGSEVLETAAGPVEFARGGTRGPTILLVHGTPGGYEQLEGLAEAAHEAGYRTLAVSRPGYLRTPLAVGRTPAEQADAYAALLAALHLDSVAIVGVSGGGPSAIEFAVRHPEHCWALVDLMGVSRAPRQGEMEPASSLESGPIAWLLGTNPGGWLMTRMLLSDPDSAVESFVPDPANARRILEDDAKMTSFVELAEGALMLPESRNAGTANDLEQFDTLAPSDLASIRVPTLVLHGTADINVPFAMGELVAEEVPGAEFVKVEGADHFMVISHSEEILGAMFAFLDRQQAN